VLSRSAAKRYVDLGKPSERYGVVALAAGLASLLPPLAPLAAAVAAAASLLGTVLADRLPERYAGGRKMMAGLLLSALGMSLFLVEAQLFWRWKVDQAYEERLAVTRYRMSLLADALGSYRQETGAYPEVTGIMATRKLLQPKYGALVPTLDAFDGAISVDSRPEGFTLTAWPPPRPGTDWAPPPVVVQGGFQPAPAPPPPPPEAAPETPGESPPAQGAPPSSEGGSDTSRPKPTEPASADAGTAKEAAPHAPGSNTDPGPP
jgi:hypothetical protein